MQNEEAPNKATKVRLGVTQNSQSPEKARISLEVQHDGLINANVSGDENLVQIIHKELQNLAAEIDKAIPPSERLTLLKVSVCERLEGESLTVKEIPDSDVQYKFEFDLNSGVSIGTESVLHEYTDVDAELTRNIQSAIQSAFQQGPKSLINEIERKLAVEDHIGAVEAVKQGVELGQFFGQTPPELLVTLQKININELDIEEREFISSCILDTALLLKRYDVAEHYANNLIKAIDQTDKNRLVFLKNIIAVASIERDELETAILIWEELLKDIEDIEPDNRGWIWNNYSMALPANDPKAKKAAKYSIDAFIEAGDKRQAGKCMMHLSHLLSHEDPNLAINQLNDILEIIDHYGLIDSELRANIQHQRAKKLNDLRSYVDAFASANEAVNLRRGKIGLEQALIASLNLAFVTAQLCGNQVAADKLEQESMALETSISSDYHEIARRVISLSSNYDSEKAFSLLSEAKEFGSPELVATINLVIAQLDSTLDTVSRVRRLESTLLELSEDHSIKLELMKAIGVILSKEGQYSRALIWFRRVLEKNPFSLDVRERVIDCHWKNEDWGEAAIFLKEQINRFGELPNLLYAYGRSLVESGNYSDGIRTLTKALQGVDEAEPLYKLIVGVRERALNAGGTILPITTSPNIGNTALAEDIRAALNEFSVFVAADKRMRFWTKEPTDQDYKWVEKPERLAQDFLHIYLKAKFQHQVLVVEELTTGAGRLDLFLTFAGGLSIIIELKMCGFGYTTTYASSGEDQIRHYMDNRNTHLGFLVVFDSRLNDHPGALLQNISDGINTVHEILVDMKPRVGKKKKPKSET